MEDLPNFFFFRVYNRPTIQRLLKIIIFFELFSLLFRLIILVEWHILFFCRCFTEGVVKNQFLYEIYFNRIQCAHYYMIITYNIISIIICRLRLLPVFYCNYVFMFGFRYGILMSNVVR